MAKGNTFDKMKPVITVLVAINSIIPKKINKFFLKIFRHLPGYLGILTRYVLLKNICLNVGKNVAIYEGVVFDAPEMMEFGDNVAVYPYCYLAGEITVGNNVAFAHTTSVHSANHTWADLNTPIIYNPIVTKRIVIENDVWIGCNCIILSGVLVGGRSIVAAGSVVNKNVAGNTIVGGNPAKIIRIIS